jgi:hypothetical protein
MRRHIIPVIAVLAGSIFFYHYDLPWQQFLIGAIGGLFISLVLTKTSQSTAGK